MTILKDLIRSWDGQRANKQRKCLSMSGHSIMSDRYKELRSKQSDFLRDFSQEVGRGLKCAV